MREKSRELQHGENGSSIESMSYHRNAHCRGGGVQMHCSNVIDI